MKKNYIKRSYMRRNYIEKELYYINRRLYEAELYREETI